MADIHIVFGENGEYGEWRRWPVCGFASKRDAEQHVVTLTNAADELTSKANKAAEKERESTEGWDRHMRAMKRLGNQMRRADPHFDGDWGDRPVYSVQSVPFFASRTPSGEPAARPSPENDRE